MRRRQTILFALLAAGVATPAIMGTGQCGGPPPPIPGPRLRAGQTDVGVLVGKADFFRHLIAFNEKLGALLEIEPGGEVWVVHGPEQVFFSELDCQGTAFVHPHVVNSLQPVRTAPSASQRFFVPTGVLVEGVDVLSRTLSGPTDTYSYCVNSTQPSISLQLALEVDLPFRLPLPKPLHVGP